jgi:hypothetical protein
MLKLVDDKLVSPWDPQECHDAYWNDKEDSQAEEMRFSQWKKQRAEAKKAAAQVQVAPKPESKPWDPEDPADDRNWFTEEPEEAEAEDK